MLEILTQRDLRILEIILRPFGDNAGIGEAQVFRKGSVKIENSSISSNEYGRPAP